MSGLCPYGLASPVCVPGPKWTPNGKEDYDSSVFFIDFFFFFWSFRSIVLPTPCSLSHRQFYRERTKN